MSHTYQDLNKGIESNLNRTTIVEIGSDSWDLVSERLAFDRRTVRKTSLALKRSFPITFILQ